MCKRKRTRQNWVASWRCGMAMLKITTEMELGVDGRDTFKVLLVGDSPQSFSLSCQILETNGGECHFAGSTDAGEDLLRLSHFDLVLSTHIVPSCATQRLVGILSGSRVSLFSSLRVEEGFWWLPILQFGKEYYGPAVPAEGLAQVIDDLRKQMQFQREAAEVLRD